jgi:LAO/AO transport system kinase
LVDQARALADRVLSGEVRAVARLMRLIDDEVSLGLETLALLHRVGREGHLIGITGGPGAGKSSLCDQLVAHHRALGRKVGVVAVDPTSPRTGGAVLGDRVRLQRHALDENVFIRSLAARGAYGGLSASASAIVRVLEAIGFDPVLLETVGIGQTEVDIARVAQTTVAVFAPGLGDEVQAMKAGLLEVPDLFVVNKADREGADVLARELEVALHQRVLKTNAVTGEGVAELALAISAHRESLGVEERSRRNLSRARLELETALYRTLRASALAQVGGEAAIAESAQRIATRASDLYTETARLLRG